MTYQEKSTTIFAKYNITLETACQVFLRQRFRTLRALRSVQDLRHRERASEERGSRRRSRKRARRAGGFPRLSRGGHAHLRRHRHGCASRPRPKRSQPCFPARSNTTRTPRAPTTDTAKKGTPAARIPARTTTAGTEPPTRHPTPKSRGHPWLFSVSKRSPAR